MKKTSYLMLLAMVVSLFAACNDYETYSDLKKKERQAISKFLVDSAINVISEKQFEEQGQTTDLKKNQYVLLDKSGVYMQIIRKGCGQQVESGKTVNVLCRFSETNILTDSMLIRNDIVGTIYMNGQYIDVSQYVDKMTVQRNGSTFQASFVSGMMQLYHGTSSVPSGWLVPLLYINVGRPLQEGDEIAKVKLIVPHSQGTQTASQSVYPAFYVITYQRDN
ncbi:DUF4827 domain-containing protein [Prevotella sp. P3-120]|uniref:DUF4827 domain-containing protein n=1 Tax=Xylanibacter brevis TaxID=83231 RepID=A0ABS9CI15_9BACT|nr:MULTISPECIES: DUF4827 domain-containing protein [Prevotellaceae]MBS7319743.1 DUF4827 domain-containing protein [Prevotella sp.]MCF2560527.1 DUF4827 domain-containing protein [Xylanibacter brevis]MCF2564714.1 DUF4827 domain-containing protein [Xylanibacter brevis]MCI7002069.1 DUF4827 domain-containing protein [Prevotella sp.]MDD7173002.1 DUF4827 domain-containing protein [Prevotella sp.]